MLFAGMMHQKLETLTVKHKRTIVPRHDLSVLGAQRLEDRLYDHNRGAVGQDDGRGLAFVALDVRGEQLGAWDGRDQAILGGRSPQRERADHLAAPGTGHQAAICSRLTVRHRSYPRGLMTSISA
jgi:hypothetical protein